MRSGAARVPDLAPADLDRIIQAVRQETQAAEDEYEEVDLSAYGALAEQMAYLEQIADGHGGPGPLQAGNQED